MGDALRGAGGGFDRSCAGWASAMNQTKDDAGRPAVIQATRPVGEEPPGTAFQPVDTVLMIICCAWRCR